MALSDVLSVRDLAAPRSSVGSHVRDDAQPLEAELVKFVDHREHAGTPAEVLLTRWGKRFGSKPNQADPLRDADLSAILGSRSSVPCARFRVSQNELTGEPVFAFDNLERPARLWVNVASRRDCTAPLSDLTALVAYERTDHAEESRGRRASGSRGRLPKAQPECGSSCRYGLIRVGGADDPVLRPGFPSLRISKAWTFRWVV